MITSEVIIFLGGQLLSTAAIIGAVSATQRGHGKSIDALWTAVEGIRARLNNGISERLARMEQKCADNHRPRT